MNFLAALPNRSSRRRKSLCTEKHGPAYGPAKSYRKIIYIDCLYRIAPTSFFFFACPITSHITRNGSVIKQKFKVNVFALNTSDLLIQDFPPKNRFIKLFKFNAFSFISPFSVMFFFLNETILIDEEDG